MHSKHWEIELGQATYPMIRLTQPTKVDFRFHEPEALADFCTANELGERLRLIFVGGIYFAPNRQAAYPTTRLVS